VNPVAIYPTDSADIDLPTVERVVGAIEGLSDDHITSVVDRVPEDFLNPAAKTVIKEGLLYRKTRVRDALKPVLGAKP
jgi:hypothetical protein